MKKCVCFECCVPMVGNFLKTFFSHLLYLKCRGPSDNNNKHLSLARVWNGPPPV